MGGFVIDFVSNSHHKRTKAVENEGDDQKYIPGNTSHFTLTAQGVLLLVESGYSLPEISEEEILDRSKSDGLAKTLVCLQAGYMIVQCASRLASRLPLSFLEINTLGHVICALVMYTFWLKKPQDVRTPTRLPEASLQRACAYMYMTSSVSKAYEGTSREFSRLHLYDSSELESNLSVLPTAQEIVLQSSDGSAAADLDNSVQALAVPTRTVKAEVNSSPTTKDS